MIDRPADHRPRPYRRTVDGPTEPCHEHTEIGGKDADAPVLSQNSLETTARHEVGFRDLHTINQALKPPLDIGNGILTHAKWQPKSTRHWLRHPHWSCISPAHRETCSSHHAHCGASQTLGEAPTVQAGVQRTPPETRSTQSIELGWEQKLYKLFGNQC